MPSNGAAVRLPLEIAPLPEPPAAPTTGKPAAPPAAAGIEVELGRAVASAATAVARAMMDYDAFGVMDGETKEAGGSRIARVATLQIDHKEGDLDFIARARNAGRRELRQHIDADFHRQHRPEYCAAAIDFYLDAVFEVVAKVVADERAFRAAWAN